MSRSAQTLYRQANVKWWKTEGIAINPARGFFWIHTGGQGDFHADQTAKVSRVTVCSHSVTDMTASASQGSNPNLTASSAAPPSSIYSK
jgi:hypothetical protein